MFVLLVKSTETSGKVFEACYRALLGEKRPGKSGKKSWVSVEKIISSSWINTVGRSWVRLTVTSLLTLSGGSS